MGQTMLQVLLILSLILVSSPPHGNSGNYDLIIVRQDESWDSLVARIYADREGVPILSTSTEEIDPTRLRELMQYSEALTSEGRKGKVLIIGGERAISPRVEEELREMGFEVNRISALDRYHTAADVARKLWGPQETVVITNGDDIGYALIAQRWALELESPILLAREEELPEATENVLKYYIKPRKVVLVGKFSKEVISSIKGLGIKVETKKVGERIPPREMEEERRFSMEFFRKIVYPSSLVISFLLGALVYKHHYRIREVLKPKIRIPMLVLTSDERRIVEEIIRSGGEIKQEEISQRTGFSRSKVSRIISELEERGVITRERVGKTYILRLARELVEG